MALFLANYKAPNIELLDDSVSTDKVSSLKSEASLYAALSVHDPRVCLIQYNTKVATVM